MPPLKFVAPVRGGKDFCPALEPPLSMPSPGFEYGPYDTAVSVAEWAATSSKLLNLKCVESITYKLITV
ncbi:hypothetical protein TNCV_219481 [Trichonephila clavipes]|nr:hypothetical protein TNCV_219481 [Trichonephila clavipes]